jgi:hypothetical protein
MEQPTRPWIHQGRDLVNDLEFIARRWKGLRVFLNNLSQLPTQTEIEKASVASKAKLQSINQTACDIYDRLDDERKVLLSKDRVYPGLAR